MSAVLEAEVRALKARVDLLEAKLEGKAGSASSGTGGGAIASDEDLDSEWGDPVVKKDPKRWLDKGGASYAGCQYSQCPSDYLKQLASLFDWMADQDESKGKTYTNKRTGKEEPTAPFNRKAAARARGWARRNEGKTAKPAGTFDPGPSDADDSIPF